MLKAEEIKSILKENIDVLPDATSRSILLEKFYTQGLPGNKNEEYKFTPLGQTLGKSAHWISDVPKQASQTGQAEPIAGTLHIQLLAGSPLNIPTQLPEGLFIEIDTADFSVNSEDPFALLNGAMRKSTLLLKATKPVETVIHLDHLPCSVSFAGSIRIHVSEGASLTVIETLPRAGSEFCNLLLNSEVKQDANLNFAVQQSAGPSLNIVYNAQILQKSNSRVETFTLTTDGGIVRNNFKYLVDGEAAEANVFGLYLLSGKTLADNHTVVDHMVPNANSNELFKGIISDQAKGVFNGKIFVRQDAQKTNAFQSNRNILLSDKATVNTKPQLEIWADDVKCSHGCTTGQLDDNALFYLRSRGIDKKAAQAMLLNAFAVEVVERINHPFLKDWASKLVASKISNLS